MKNLSQIGLFILVFLNYLTVESQEYHMVQPDDTFYDFLMNWYDSTNFNYSDTAEGVNRQQKVYQ
ncbi:MAG: hypothetical protein KBC43_13450 [Bacteroidales bacterium]|nr:hypothetical protein [Bacteroidales bacterium]